MWLITRKDLAANAAERWKKAYTRKGEWQEGTLIRTRTKEEIYNQLVALGPTPNPDDVDATIGNTSWTGCRCDECGHKFDAVIQVGEAPCYESSTANLCRHCVQHAWDMMK